jgi:hypothetical protein
LDEDHDGKISPKEFFHLCDVLLMDNFRGSMGHSPQVFDLITSNQCVFSLRARALQLVVHRHFESVSMCTLGAYGLFILVEATKLQNHAAKSSFEAVHLTFLLVFTLEFSLKIAAHGMLGYWNDVWNRYY